MNKKGFTLIELLAVIIILGVLMLIAIPSVTKYIDNSRKESYLSTVKTLTKGAVNQVNTGIYDVFDLDTTYYLPISCISSENAKVSPYGDLVSSYVVFVYDGNGFDYYYTGTDTSNMGILLTHVNKITINDIKTGIKESQIDTSIGVDNRNNNVLINCDGSKQPLQVTDTIPREGTYVPDAPIPEGYTIDDYTLASGSLKIPSTDSKISSYESIKFLKNSNVPSSAIDTWYVGKTNKNKVVAWTLDEDNDGLKEMYIGSDSKIYANPDSSCLFCSFRSVTVIDITNLDTSLVTNMSRMFAGSGTDSDIDMNVEYIRGLDRINTRNVTNMRGMFEYCSNLKELDLSNFNTSNVTDMSRMFSGWFHGNGALTAVDASNFDISKVTTMESMFVFTSKLRSIKIGKSLTYSVTNVRDMFGQMTNRGGITIDISNIHINDNTNTEFMFDLTITNHANSVIYIDSAESRDRILSSNYNRYSNAMLSESDFVIK